MECRLRRADEPSTGSEQKIAGGFGEALDLSLWAAVGALSYIVELERIARLVGPRCEGEEGVWPSLRSSKMTQDAPLDDTVMLPAAVSSVQSSIPQTPLYFFGVSVATVRRREKRDGFHARRKVVLVGVRLRNGQIHDGAYA